LVANGFSAEETQELRFPPFHPRMLAILNKGVRRC
jgi:hypothetical protein